MPDTPKDPLHTGPRTEDSPAVSMLLGGPASMLGAAPGPVAIWSPFGPTKPGAADVVETMAREPLDEAEAARALRPDGTQEVRPEDILLEAYAPVPSSARAASRVAVAPSAVGTESLPAAAPLPVQSTQSLLASLDRPAPRAPLAAAAPWMTAPPPVPPSEATPGSITPVELLSAPPAPASAASLNERRKRAGVLLGGAVVVAAVLGASLAFFVAPLVAPSSAPRGAAASVAPAERENAPVEVPAHAPEPASVTPSAPSAATATGLASNADGPMSVDSLPKSTIAAGTGRLVLGKVATQHRVFVDGRVVPAGGGSIDVKCGRHTVKIGSRGRTRPVQVPCGGELSLSP